MSRNDDHKQPVRVCVTQLGVRQHYLVPIVLEELGMLDRLFTDNYLGNRKFLASLIEIAAKVTKAAPLHRYMGRNSPLLPPGKVQSFERLGILEQLRRYTRKRGEQPVDLYVRFSKLFANAVVKAGFGDANTVFGFNGASQEIFEAAKSERMKCVLDQTIVPIPILRRIMKKEIERHPGWQPGLQVLAKDNPLTARDAREWDLADIILCGSKFVSDGVIETGGKPDKCHIVPYGVRSPDGLHYAKKHKESGLSGKPLKLLYAGEVGLRKGAPYLLEAMSRIKPGTAMLRLAGQVSLSDEIVERFRDSAQFLGRVPLYKMNELYEWADAFILPSLAEGSALVTHEAKMHGLPVICTPNAGSTIEDGVNGLNIEPFSSQAIVEAIEKLPDLIERMQSKYPEEVEDSYESYKLQLANILRELRG